MKKVRCPKCDNRIQFDETKYDEGQSLVFVCGNCKKEFRIRIGVKSSETASDSPKPQLETAKLGSIVVVENVFGRKQVFDLKEGDNLIGRRFKGTEADIAVETNDPSMDRRHCCINVKRKKNGEIVYTLRDNGSVTGTFLMNELLGDKDRTIIEAGAIITLGATTIILKD